MDYMKKYSFVSNEVIQNGKKKKDEIVLHYDSVNDFIDYFQNTNNTIKYEKIPLQELLHSSFENHEYSIDRLMDIHSTKKKKRNTTQKKKQRNTKRNTKRK